ncbi:MAG: response regulator [Chitinophagales bacterium]
MTAAPIHLLLADDDKDDCMFFEEAIEELPFTVELTTVNDGEQLLNLLSRKTSELPNVLYLDLNMPRKNGLECLTEIKGNDELKDIPVIIYSTSYDPDMVSQLYDKGAQYYFRKPAEFYQLKKVILKSLTLSFQAVHSQPEKQHFIIQP